MKNHATIISSIRGNLPINYRIEYGLPGMLAALLQFCILRRFDSVVAMSNRMVEQLRNFGLKRIHLIGNFLDEKALEPYRCKIDRVNDNIRFLFLARLSAIKRPELLILAIRSLRKLKLNCHLDLIGDGPLQQSLVEEVNKYNISDRVTFHGYLPEPFKVLQSADYLVIPSQSEGISRAALEALFFGIPCILRDVDTNNGTINPGINGFLFRKDEDLIDVLRRAVLSVQNGTAPRGGNLLPKFFRQDECIKKFEVLING